MKRITILSTLLFLSVLVLYSCQKEEVITDELVKTKTITVTDFDEAGEAAVRGPGGGKGNNKDDKGKGNGPGTIYEMTFGGNTLHNFNDEPIFGLNVASNKTHDRLSANECHTPFKVSGIPALAGPTDCYPDWCITGFGLRLFDKRKYPGRVTTNLYFYHPSCGVAISRLWLIGSIVGVAGQNNNTLFVEEGQTVTIVYDEWYLNSGCEAGCSIGSKDDHRPVPDGQQLWIKITIPIPNSGLCNGNGTLVCD